MSLLLYFKERRQRSVVTVSDKPACKRNEVILAAHLMYTFVHQLKLMNETHEACRV